MGPIQSHARRRRCAGVLAGFFLAATVVVSPPLAFAFQQTGAPRVLSSASNGIAGQVQDPSGAIVAGAKILLKRDDGTIAASATSDSAGRFRMVQPAPGKYSLVVVLAGFEPLLRPMRIGPESLKPLNLTLNIASVSTSVVVNAADSVEVAAPEHNQDSASISADDMKSLPIFDGDVVSALSAFLDAGIAGEGGTTLIVDGVEMKSVGVSPSAIERVSVNQDPYSAEYRQPGRGQVEIVTKSTADHFHGSASFTFRNSALNATNYFAASKPSEQRRLYEGYLTGPIKLLPAMSFLFSINHAEEDAYAQVNANTAPGVYLKQNVAAPNRTTYLSFKVAHQYNDHHSDYVQYRFYDSSHTNQNVGGLVLPSGGAGGQSLDQDVVYHDDLAIGANKFNQFSILFERNSDSTISEVVAPSVVVQGAFIGGGAQADSYNTENNPNLSEILSWTARKVNQLKFGVQMPNLGRRVFEDRTNRQGTYTFASLAAYAADTPSTFTIQQGQIRFETLYAQPAAFFLDQIQATARLTITPGVRYDFQNALPNTKDAVLPRLSLAYLLDKKHAMVVRVGSGVYVRRVGVNIGQQLARYGNAAERSLLVTTNICYTEGITTPCTPLPAQPPSLFNFEPNIKSPVQAYYGMSIEGQVTKKSTVTISYGGYRGWHALRSIDTNAPLPPFTSPVRPNPNYAQVLQLQSRGYQKSDSLIASYRGRIGEVFSGFVQYTYQHSDANTEFSTFMPENQFDPNAEWSRASTDQRQRLALYGTLFPDRPISLGLGFYDYTALPYTITTGTDDYKTGVFNARPAGVPRNSLNGGSYQDVDVRLAYTRKLRPHLKDASPAAGISVASFNTLNHVNYGGYVGVVTASDFMKPTSASDPRRLQLSANFSF